MNMNSFKIKCRLRMAGAMSFVVFTLSACAVYAQERIRSRMFDLTYASAMEVADNFNRTWRGLSATNGVAGDMAVPFLEANSVMVTAPEPVLDECAAIRGCCRSSR